MRTQFSEQTSYRLDALATTDAIRERFPALAREHNGKPVAYFDGPGGTQAPRDVVEAMTDYLYHHNANTHWNYPTSAETDAILTQAREALADPFSYGQSGHRAHRDDEQRELKRGAYPKAMCEIDQLRVRPFLTRGYTHRLQRHATDRARAGLVPNDLGMHRAGVKRALRSRRLRLALAGEFVRFGLEFLLAAG